MENKKNMNNERNQNLGLLSIIVGIGSLILGFFSVIFGLFKKGKAEKNIKRAEEIRDEAIQKHEISKKSTQEELEELGKIKIEIIESFDRFLNLMGKIGIETSPLKKLLGANKLPNIKPDELKKLSDNVRIAIDSAGGAAVGAAVGLAVYGVNPLLAGPAAFAGGIVFCIKAIGLDKKACENINQAEQIKAEVDEIVRHYEELSKESKKLREYMYKVSEKYYEYLEKLEAIVSEEKERSQFTKSEYDIYKKCEKFVALLYKMCNTSLEKKNKDNNSIEIINIKDLREVEKEAEEVLKKVA